MDELVVAKSNDKITIDIKENSGIIIPSYNLVEFNTEQATGDYVKSYVIRFDYLDFQRIISQIENSKYYVKEYKTDISHDKKINEDLNKQWKKASFGYKFEYFIDGTDKLILYEVNTTNYTIYAAYAEE